ncbi:MAG: hypothetical protein Q9193_001334 [Seirophora villosa]
MSLPAQSADDTPNPTLLQLPNQPWEEASPASPQVTPLGEMEPNDRDSSESKLPLHEDVMQLARLGEIGPIQTLFEEGKYKANHTDAENITPLHVRLHTICARHSLQMIATPSAETFAVGCDQQSLRTLSISHRSRSRR